MNLVDPDGRLTNQGSELNSQIRRAIEPTVTVYYNAGYTIHEIMYILYSQISEMEFEMRLNRVMKEEDERNKRNDETASLDIT